MRDMKYDIARSVAMIWVVGIYHLSEYLFSPLHELQWARMVTWGCLGTFTFISAYFLAGKNEFNNWTQIRVFYGKRLLRLYPLFVLSALTLLLIGFNNWEQTWKGVLGVSTFFAPQINTLWYVSMLIGFYLLTPFLQRGGGAYKLVVYGGIMAGVALFKILIHTGVDNRFFYYFTVYTAGILFARHTPPRTQAHLYASKTLLITGVIAYLLCLGWVLYRPNALVMMVGGFIGTFLLLSGSNRLTDCSCIGKPIRFFSYGSMAAYLFHRQIYYCGLSVYNPQNEWWKAVYLVLVILPVIFFISYCIQLCYDRLISSGR